MQLHTTLSLTIQIDLHSFSCCYVRNLRNPAKFSENTNLYSSRSSKVIDCYGIAGDGGGERRGFRGLLASHVCMNYGGLIFPSSNLKHSLMN